MKPKPVRRRAVDYDEAEKYIEAKLGYPLRDTLGLYSGSKGHYVAWCEKHGEEDDMLSQDQYARYRDAPDGEATAPEYRDYWHFLVDRCEVRNGGTVRISSDLLESSAPWQQEITRAFIEEFGECEFWTEW